MDERRKLERKYLIVYSRVFERNKGKMLGYLGDLSISGAMIISEHKQEENSVLPLRFDLPDVHLFDVDHLNISARIAHCDPDLNPAFYNIGFEFLDLTELQKKTITQMMDAYEFRRDVPDYPTPPSALRNDD
ncbi:MAG: PilZ domain-containing protein [Anaerolineae bacterium]|nr:PilZ domain-containing protein [Anaerolineae bacterium]MDK1081213.1 PilZ domain-containing protein [Anaerolineae bacterium]MDK1118354.1 PilZ domain-containing protein [Anaerolineae bacterium]